MTEKTDISHEIEKEKIEEEILSQDDENQDDNESIDIETLKEEPSLEDEVKEYRNKYLCLLAEMDNTRKRMQKEKHETTRFAVENAISEILPPIDNMENALKFADQMSGEVKNWAMGFQMILAQFKEYLQNHDIHPFHSEGVMFNPHLHEAVEVEETNEHEEGTILQEFLKGYKSGERTLRAARVKVAKQPKNNKQEEEETHDE